MIEPKTGMDSVNALKAVGESRGREFVWAEPATQIEIHCCNTQKNNANAAEPHKRARFGQRRWLPFR
jgi:hypothetical protein